MKKIVINIVVLLTLAVPAYADQRGLAKSLRAAVDRDTVCNVWVRFESGAARGAAAPVSDRALSRRRRAGFVGDDRLIDPSYIYGIERRGGRLRHQFPWGDAASFTLHASRLNEIAALPYVKSVTPVAVYVRKNINDGGLGKPAAPRSGDAGYRWHNEMVNIPLAHAYIRTKGLGAPGAGTVAAFFDTGFRLGHRAFTNGRDSADFIVSAYDFVDMDDTVADPDSVNNDIWHPYRRNDQHGTQCLALVAGRDSGSYIGGAWGARFLLARTEDNDIEAKTEEDNWAAAVVWAEAHGAQIISSSLGYRDGFDDEDDYDYGDMDGLTTIISKAAAGAVARGVIVVNAMGNERNHIPGTIVAPADVDGVVAVGAVDGSRRLAFFSSSGPTADGRSKPDVSAPGVSVPLVDPYAAGLSNYRTGNGTSFAAPIVSGIFALILQVHPGIGANEARERLYRSCAFAQGQTAANDNLHGYGIPDALRAVMNDDEIFLKITDTAARPLQGATVKAGAKTYTVDEYGGVIITAQTTPLDLKIIFRGATLRTLTVGALPFADELALDVSTDNGLKVLPNIVKRGGVIRGLYYFSPTDRTPVFAIIRTITGRTVWRQTLRLRADGVAEFTWNRRANGSKMPPGVYLLTIRQGGNSISQKFVITN